MGAYLRLGIAHVMHNADRWCFVLGLLLLVQRWRDLGCLILALAGGYLLALLLAMTGWVLPRLSPLEAFMAFLVALLGAVICRRDLHGAGASAKAWPARALLLVLAVALLRSPSAILALLGAAAIALGVLGLAHEFESRASVWPGLVVVFGFLDGFVLPAVLPPARLPQGLKLQMLIGFDLGAMLCDALLIALAVATWQILGTRGSGVPRAALHDVCAAGLSGLGAFWLLSRLG